MFLKRDDGFTLIEVVASMAILGLTSLMALYIVQSASGVSDRVLFSEDLAEVQNFARITSMRLGACGLREPGTGDPITFPNDNFPRSPTDLTLSSPPVPVNVYLISKTDDPLEGKLSLSERFNRNRRISIRAVELILPDAVDKFEDGEQTARGRIVVHPEKRRPDGVNEPLPPIIVDTVLRLNVSDPMIALADCGQSWYRDVDLSFLPTEGIDQDDLTNGAIQSKNLGEHRFCVIIDRGVKTGRSRRRDIFGGGWKDQAQRAEFSCSLRSPVPTDKNWYLDFKARKEDGKDGHFNCQAFCI